ncbi:MAG: CARDB domain-containing protein [Candidatus Aenigmatarchaeota archaeon]
MTKKNLIKTLVLFLGFFLVFPTYSQLIVNYQISEKEIYPNSYATLILNIQNPTKNEIRSINIIFESNEYIEIYPKRFNLEKLIPNSLFSQSFLIKTSENAKTTNIKAYISYYIDSEKKSFDLNIPIKIIRFPILFIKNVEFSSEYLELGKNITVTLEIYNSGYSSARDVKIKILPNQNIVPHKDEFYIKEIRKFESSKISITLLANSWTSVGYYSIPFLISYFDEDYSRIFNETKSFSLKVLAKPKLDVLLEDVYENRVSIKIVNVGLSKAKNILIKINEKSFFIEELNSGDYDIVDVDLKEFLLVSLTYFDSLNNKYEEEKEISIETSNLIISQKYQSRIKNVQQSNQSIQMFPILYIIVISIFIILSIIIYKSFSKKKKK